MSNPNSEKCKGSLMSQFSETKINDSQTGQVIDPAVLPYFAFDKDIAAHQQCAEVKIYSGDPDSARQFKREVEQEYRAEIRQLREESAAKDRAILLMQADFVQLKTEFKAYKNENQKPLAAAQAMAEASRTMQKAMAILIAVLMAIGGAAASIDAIKKWFGSTP